MSPSTIPLDDQLAAIEAASVGTAQANLAGHEMNSAAWEHCADGKWLLLATCTLEDCHASVLVTYRPEGWHSVYHHAISDPCPGRSI